MKTKYVIRLFVVSYKYSIEYENKNLKLKKIENYND